MKPLPTFTPDEREKILARAITRPDSPLVRRLTTGLIGLARQLELNQFMPADKVRELTPEEAEEQAVATTWLLDRRNSLDVIRGVAAKGYAWFRETHLAPDADYRFGLPCAVQAAANNEIALTLEEMAAGDFIPVTKPTEGKASAPPGK